jgi:hypothetical protein
MHPVVRAILQGGDVRTYIYNNGDLCSLLTGGWGGVFTRATYTITQLTLGASTMDGTFAAASQLRQVYRNITNPIDLTNFNKVCMKYDGTLSNNASIMHALFVLTGTDHATWVANTTKSGAQGTSITDGIIEVDISALSGNHYVIPSMAQSSGAVSLSGTLHVKEVWLE